MSIRLADSLRIAVKPPPLEAPPEPTETRVRERSPEYARIRRELHQELIASLNLARMETRPRHELEPKLRTALETMLAGRVMPLTGDEQALLTSDVLDEILGLGPLDRLIRDPSISDILINGPGTIFIERKGKLVLSEIRFDDDRHLMHALERIVSAVGRRIDESTPMVDARLADGSRVNAIIPPLALNGPVVSIRRFGAKPIQAADLVRFGAFPEPILALLEGCVRAKLNMVVSGGTGSGKTTLLNVLSGFIPHDERIITIEDAAELRLQQPHVVSLETRPPNVEGHGEITARDLVKNALRMRPDRIIVGEIRGGEAIDMLQAMNTGHAGSIGTLHANSPRHAFRRIETMIGLAIGNISGPAVREMIADALHLVLQVNRLEDGSRRLISVTEVTGQENGVISAQEIFQFHQRTIDATGRVRGVFRCTGIRPLFTDKLHAYGIDIPPSLLNFEAEV